MRRLVACLLASLAIYEIAFAFVLDRPLDLGLLRLEWDQKRARLAVLPSPKLVILAGSNAPYSHSCAVIGPMLGVACENAGIAVGFGLDVQFAVMAPDLHAGDWLYLPMEPEQYTTTRAEMRAGVDAEILLRHERGLLAALPADRVAGALLCCDVRALLAAVSESAALGLGVVKPKELLAREFDEQGDRIDTPLARADAVMASIAAPVSPRAEAIEHGYGAGLIGRFVRAETARGVIVVGGLSTRFADAALSDAAIAAIARVYTDNGGRFLMLPNRSLYPRADFFDGPEHLAGPYQTEQSLAVAAGLEEKGFFFGKKEAKNF